MKILNSSQIRAADQHTIENEPIDSIDLMERASEKFVNVFKKRYNSKYSVLVVCGTGNNGGDGLAIARILSNMGYIVNVFTLGDIDKSSEDFQENYRRLDQSLIVTTIPQMNSPASMVVIDGIFGSGLSRPVEGYYAEIIEFINNSGCHVVSIDIPSGMFSDSHFGEGAVIKSDLTISFQSPKLSFFLPSNNLYIKEWLVVDIGLDKSFIGALSSGYELLEKKTIATLLRDRPVFFHKGDAGRALLVSGSLGKIGAAVLSSRATLRSGAGLLEVHVPKAGTDVIHTSVPEAMALVDKHNEIITQSMDVTTYDAIAFGPGLGTQEDTIKAFEKYLNRCQKPVVLDADSLNMISKRPALKQLIPPNSILTPHPGEFKRLVGEYRDDYQRLELQRKFSNDHKVIIVLKNAFSSITAPNGQVFFNSTGNPGMATAGSGDVLTGITLGILAQGYSPLNTALIATYLHGMAGDLALQNGSVESLVSTDIIEYIGAAFAKIRMKDN